MDFRSFKASLGQPTPPAGLSRPLVALWHVGRGDWDAAHKLAQQDEGEPLHDWVHAHLHRVEGDLGNAGYWYRRAGKSTATGSTDAEWAAIVEAMLTASG
ncbi:MAG: hypothetical protein GC202_05050 [Alphaproteobacteria bacterium]|nr:hypothetical protein [Alphaproteobacteria bacterium]